MVKKAAAYARYSTDNQTDNSIAYQMYEITRYCAKNEIDLTHSFIDEGESGTNTNRNGFQEMITTARAKEFNTIIIYDVSRGSRDIADWFLFHKQMRELGISVVSCHQTLGDPLNPDDFLHEFITVGLGHHMVLETRQKAMAGIAAVAREGRFLGGKAPYGYEVKNQEYVIVPSEAEFVRNAFQLYADGYSYRYIMEHLRVRDIIGRHGAPLNQNSLYYMFKNPRYAGIYIWNEYTYRVMRKYIGRTPNPEEVRIEGAIPAIVSMEVWSTVQTRLENNKIQNRRINPAAKQIFLLSGLIRCGVCGAAYTAHTSRSKGHEYVYYCCTNRYGKKRGENACSSTPVRGDRLEAIVLDAIKRCLNAHSDFPALANHIAMQFNKEMQADLTAEYQELESIKVKINNGVNAILDGFDTPELRDQIDQLKRRKKS